MPPVNTWPTAAETSVDDGLKQRIIGAFVLIALVMLFVPALFDRDRIQPLDEKSLIPPVPELVSQPFPEPTAEVAEIEEEEEVIPSQVFVPDETRPQTLVEEAPDTNAKGLPLSWTLQVASFSSLKRAQELLDKLTAEGYSAYTREAETRRGNMIRVYVGPKLDKSALIREKQAIDEKYGLTSLILRFSS